LVGLCTVGGSAGWFLLSCAVASVASDESGTNDGIQSGAFWSVAIVLGTFLALCRGFLSKAWLRLAVSRRRRHHRGPAGADADAGGADDTGFFSDNSDDDEEDGGGGGGGGGEEKKAMIQRPGSSTSSSSSPSSSFSSSSPSSHQAKFVVLALYILCAGGLGVLSALTTSDRCLVVTRVLLVSTIPVSEVVAAAPWAERGTDRLVSIWPVFLVVSLLSITVVNIE